MSDLASLALFAAALAAIVLGFPIPVLVAALVASLVLNLSLLLRLRAAIQDRASLLDTYERSHAGFTGIMPMLLQTREAVADLLSRVRAPAAASEPDPDSDQSTWLPDPKDLTTLALARADFEACHERALEITKLSLGDDSEARFEAALLYHAATAQRIPPTPWVEINVVSPSSMKRATVRFYGTSQKFEVAIYPIERDQLDAERRMAVVTPWRTDPSWNALVHASWRRMHPFSGSVVLTAIPSRLTGEECLWRIAFDPTGSDPARLFTMRRGGLVAI